MNSFCGDESTTKNKSSSNNFNSIHYHYTNANQRYQNSRSWVPVRLIQTNTTIGAGQNITGSLSLRNMLAKTAGSEVHVSLANASTIAEKTVGPNSHAASVRIGVVRGFVVYIALVSDINHSIHSVLVDAGNGKVLRSTQLSIAPMMMRHG
ncbi:MAG: hypothetical protein WAM42_21720 [Candidatus Nitrosopolaris sp.]